MLGDAFWPGDAALPGIADKADFLVYAKAVYKAKDVGPKIAAYLRQRNDVMTVHFVAHSLGCRVTLEAIDDLQKNGGPEVGRVCLMAAAVPTFKLVPPNGDLWPALNAAKQVLVLYSPDDLVALTLSFPPGQTIASLIGDSDEGFMPSALGRTGDMPVTPGKLDRQQVEGADHGDYWGHNSNTPTDKSARAMFDFFRFEELVDRRLGARSVASNRASPGARQVAGSD
jgi:pimeloyl-ACP methyl ester carboxylesterase